MERRRVPRAVAAEEAVAIGEHRLRLWVDAAVAHPWRIADDRVEAAARQHVREVDVEREECELAVFHAIEDAAVLLDARVQLAATREIRVAQPAEEIALRRGEILQLRLVEIDRLRQELAGDPLIVGADEARQRRAI